MSVTVRTRRRTDTEREAARTAAAANVYPCPDCGLPFTKRGLMGHETCTPGSRRFVVELDCGHSYGVLLAADRPHIFKVGEARWCTVCRSDQAVRGVA